jgi:hypothetical protein
MVANGRELVQELFVLDEDIRWVGAVDQAGSIVCIRRPGVESFVDSATDELTLKEFPTIVGVLWRQLAGQSGELKSLVITYTRVYS